MQRIQGWINCGAALKANFPFFAATKSTVFQFFAFLAHSGSTLVLSGSISCSLCHWDSDSLWLTLALSLANSGSLCLSLSSSLRRSSAHKVLVRFATWQLRSPSLSRPLGITNPFKRVLCEAYSVFMQGKWSKRLTLPTLWDGGGVIYLFFFRFLRHRESFFQLWRRTSVGPDPGCLLVFIKCFIQSQTNSCYSYLSDATSKVFPCPMNDFLAYLSIPLSDSCPTV